MTYDDGEEPFLDNDLAFEELASEFAQAFFTDATQSRHEGDFDAPDAYHDTGGGIGGNASGGWGSQAAMRLAEQAMEDASAALSASARIEPGPLSNLFPTSGVPIVTTARVGVENNTGSVIRRLGSSSRNNWVTSSGRNNWVTRPDSRPGNNNLYDGLSLSPSLPSLPHAVATSDEKPSSPLPPRPAPSAVATDNKNKALTANSPSSDNNDALVIKPVGEKDEKSSKDDTVSSDKNDSGSKKGEKPSDSSGNDVNNPPRQHYPTIAVRPEYLLSSPGGNIKLQMGGTMLQEPEGGIGDILAEIDPGKIWVV